MLRVTAAPCNWDRRSLLYHHVTGCDFWQFRMSHLSISFLHPLVLYQIRLFVHSSWLSAVTNAFENMVVINSCNSCISFWRVTVKFGLDFSE